jgi:hypothetical protein
MKTEGSLTVRKTPPLVPVVSHFNSLKISTIFKLQNIMDFNETCRLMCFLHSSTFYKKHISINVNW